MEKRGNVMIKLEQQEALLKQIQVRINNCNNSKQKEQLVKHYKREKKEYHRAVKGVKEEL